VLLAHAGHGANSCAIHYFLVRGPYGLFVQASWGGVYMDPDAAAGRMRDYFDLAEALARTSEEAPSPGAPSDRLVVVVSDFSGSCWTKPGMPFPPQDGIPLKGRAVLQAALEWVRSSR
jgi:hypothetical protein